MTGESFYPFVIPVIVTLVGTLVVFHFLKLYLVGGVCKSKALLKGKTVLVTGANRGIGKETAIELARRGARVILADVQGGEETAIDIRERSGNNNVVFYHLDLASLALVRQFAAKVLEEEPKIDILVNNAGVMVSVFSHKRTKDGFELTFGVNHLGHYLLTNLLLDRLKESPAARIVNVSSYLYRYGSIHFDDLNLESSCFLPGLQAYSQSKLANLLFSRALAKRLQGSQVTVNAVNPGNTRSLLAAKAIPIFSLVSCSVRYTGIEIFIALFPGSLSTQGKEIRKSTFLIFTFGIDKEPGNEVRVFKLNWLAWFLVRVHTFKLIIIFIMLSFQGTVFRVIQKLFFKTPWQGAQTSIYCAVSEEMEGVTGQYLSDCKIQRIRHAQVTDDNAERLWQISATMVGTD